MLKYPFAVVLAGMLVMPVVFAADEAPPSHSVSHFDAEIDTWAEGTVMALDADGGTITVRGVKRPYATAYAGMLQEIHSKASTLPAEQRALKESEIRSKWAVSLADARKAETPSKDSDFTFYLPKEKHRVSFFNESNYYDHEATLKTDVKTSDYEKQAMLTFKDMRIGDRVSVGYDAGTIYNTAHVIVKVRGVSADAQKPVNASLTTESTPQKATAITSVLDADTEKARQIRRSLTSDESLSVKAKNVNISTDNGTYTLKGTVDSESEKAIVVKKAAEIVGEAHVVNQLDVLKK